MRIILALIILLFYYKETSRQDSLNTTTVDLVSPDSLNSLSIKVISQDSILLGHCFVSKSGRSDCLMNNFDTLVLVQNFYSGMMSSDFAQNGLKVSLDLNQEKSAAVLVFTDELHEFVPQELIFISK